MKVHVSIHNLNKLGVMMSYVKCLHCLGESKREESFLDLQLTVMNPFENIYNDSIEKGIDQCLIPEKLEGNNQYFCQTCMEKVSFSSIN